MERAPTKLSITVSALLLGLFFLVGVPSVASATSYNYDCGDLTSGDSPNCSAGSWDKGTAFSLLDSAGTFPLAAGTWYFSADVQGSATHPFRITCYEYSGAVCNTYQDLDVGVNTDVPITINSGTSNGIYIWGQSSSGNVIESLCVSDTLGECAGGGGTTTPPTATSTATSTLDVDSFVSLSFNSLLLFIISFVVTIWLWSMLMR